MDTVSDLMKPRYKVVSDWPGRKDFVVGEIVTLDKKFSPQYQMYEVEDCQGKRQYINSFFEMFPLQFRRLDWWQELDFKKYPKFIKWTNPADKSICYFEVTNWSTSPVSGDPSRVHTKDAVFFTGDCEPCDESEYLSQNS